MFVRLLTDRTVFAACAVGLLLLCGCEPQKPAEILPSSNRELTRLPMTGNPEIDQIRDLAGNYDVVSVGVARYARPGSSLDAFSVQAYQMPSAEDAMGLFSILRYGSVGREGKVGEDSFTTNDSVTFWKGRYVVRVRELAAADDPKIRKDLMDMAKSVANRIRAEKPDLKQLDWLPEKGQKDDSLRYIKRGIIDVDLLERAVTADYRIGDADYQAFICSFKTPAEAAAVLDKLSHRMENPSYDMKPVPTLKFDHATLGEITLIQADRFIVGTTGGQPATAAAIAKSILEKSSRRPIPVSVGIGVGNFGGWGDCDDCCDRPGVSIGFGFGN